jgi:hypothetical protein
VTGRVRDRHLIPVIRRPARPWVARAGTGLVPRPDRNYRVSLTWPRLPAAAEVALVAAGYAGYALVRLAVRASRPAAIAHAAGLWRAERWLHLDIEPSLNHLAAARPVLAETAGYYYGLAHFIITPLVLAWLWLRRPGHHRPGPARRPRRHEAGCRRARIGRCRAGGRLAAGPQFRSAQTLSPSIPTWRGAWSPGSVRPDRWKLGEPGI